MSRLVNSRAVEPATHCRPLHAEDLFCDCREREAAGFFRGLREGGGFDIDHGIWFLSMLERIKRYRYIDKDR